MTESEESEPKAPDGERAFAIQLLRIVSTLAPMVALGAGVSALSEFLSRQLTVDQWPTVSVFIGRSWPFVAGVVAAVAGVSVAVAFAQSKGRRRSQVILLELELKQKFDDAIASSLRRS